MIVKRRELVGGEEILAEWKELPNSLLDFSFKFDTMETNMGDRLDTFEEKLEVMETKLSTLETYVEEVKKRPLVNEEESSNDGAAKTNESWTLQERQTSVDGLPISVAVRHPKSKAKSFISTKPIEALKTTKSVEALKTPKPVQPLKTKLGTKVSNSLLGRKIKQEPLSSQKTKKPNVIDLSDALRTPTPADISDCSNPFENPRNKAFNGALDKLMQLCQQEDVLPRRGRARTLASNQVDPFIGSSLVKRMIRGAKLSTAAYDPFAKACQRKVDKLMAFIKQEMDNPLLDDCPASTFYMKIMSPKELWPPNDPKYGWLMDLHLCPIMHMLRKRSMVDPCPFYSKRIAFLDPWFVNQWAYDYQKFETEKNWLFPLEYFRVYQGTSPRYCMTNRKWVDDVDILYLTHHVNMDHWVALEVDLPKRRIKVYDNITSVYTDEEVYEACKQYTKMIPVLLHAMAPADVKKTMGISAFSIYRVKTAPQNYQQGDCGVYAVKFIECLALHINFEGLCDAAMPIIRRKLAAELYDEVPETDCFIQLSDPNPRGEDTSGVEFVSQS